MRGQCVRPARHAQRDKIRVAQSRLFTPAEYALDPVAYYKASYVHFIGA